MESAYVHLSLLAWIWSWSQAGQVWSYLGQCCATLSSTSSSVPSVQCSSTQSHKASGSKWHGNSGQHGTRAHCQLEMSLLSTWCIRKAESPWLSKSILQLSHYRKLKKNKLKFPITVSQHLWGLLNGSVTCSRITSVALSWVSHLLHWNKC